MSRKRKPPRLRVKDGCYVADFYRPDGRRSTISFGSPGARTAGDIYVAFGKWLDLFSQHPHEVLDFQDPYEAISKMVNATTILTVGELYDKYMEWARGFLLPLRDGSKHPDLVKVERLGKFLTSYRQWSIADFGPDELKAIQDAMVEFRYVKARHPDEPIPYTRTGINMLVNQVHKIWQWGVGRDIVTPAQRQRLREVRPLRIGRSAARDRLKRAAVTEAELNQVLQHLGTVVADMLRLIWLTTMRPGEVCHMRPCDILRADPSCWLYIPGRDASLVRNHKTAYHRRIRAIPLAASAQAILKPRITEPESKQGIFTPADSVKEMRDRRFALRSTAMGQGNEAGTNCAPHPMIVPGPQYASAAFATAVRRGCDRAGVARFTPYDLRRSAATRVRSALDKEAAKLLLGHVSADTTEIYLLDEVKEAMKVAVRLDNKQG